MSDPQNPGDPVDPVEEPAAVDDVVGHANEGLADAEAARGDAVDAPAEEVVVEETVVEGAVVEPEPAAAEPVPWYERDDVPLDDDAPTVVTEPAVTPSEPVVEETEVIAATAVAPAAVAPAAVAPQSIAPQPIFVQAPEPPRPRGNRAAAGAIGVIAAVCFGVLYLGTTLGVNLIAGAIAPSDVVPSLVGSLASWALWVPVVVFFLAFWLLGAIINRGRWGLWVIFGLLVGFASYGGHLLGQLFEAPFWNLTATQGRELVESQLWVPLAFAAFIFGRELTIWFGAWAARRGKRVSELNYEAQREYERTIEAGPPLVASAQG